MDNQDGIVGRTTLNGYAVTIDQTLRFRVQYGPDDAEYFDSAEEARQATERRRKLETKGATKLDHAVVVINHGVAMAATVTGVHMGTGALLLYGGPPKMSSLGRVFVDTPPMRERLQAIAALFADSERIKKQADADLAKLDPFRLPVEIGARRYSGVDPDQVAEAAVDWRARYDRVKAATQDAIPDTLPQPAESPA